MMLRLTYLRFAFIFGMVSPSQAEQCKMCWPITVEFEGSCFAYSSIDLPFGEAAAMCTAHSARLAQADTEAKAKFLKKLVKDSGGKSAWIGGTNALHNNTWVWLDFQWPFSLGFTDWHADEPNNINNDEACVEISEKHNYQWNQQPCTRMRRFICEYKGGKLLY